jgi:drug/metabolite transporter (DMT)-like permease
MGALTRFLGDHCHWSAIALSRAVSVLILAALSARLWRVALIYWKPPTIWVRSTAGSISLLCNFYAMTHMPLADATTISNLYPLWIAVLSWVWLRHPPSFGELLALASGLTGVVLIVQPGLGVQPDAALAALTGSVATAVAMLGLHRLRDVDPWAIVAHFSGLASLLAFGFWWTLDRDLATDDFSAPMLILLLVVGVAATVGQVCLTRAYARGKPTSVGVAGLMQVVFTMVVEAHFWHRTFTLTILLGIGLVMAPSVWLLLRRTAAAASPGVDDDAVAPAPRLEAATAGSSSSAAGDA